MTLKSEAEQVVEELDILELLNSYGIAKIVGGVALDLIVKRDIDIHVYVMLTDINGLSGEIIPVLLDKLWTRNIRVDKYTEKQAVKVSLDGYPGPTGPWDIEIWLTTQYESTGFDITESLQEKLTPDQRLSILAIKDHYHRMGVLRNGLSSRIYEAVLNGGVRSVREFQTYLGTISH